MKRFLAVTLVLLLAFSALVACGDNNPTTGGGEPEAFDAFEKAAHNTIAAVISVDTKLETKFGDLNSKTVTTFKPNGSSVIEHSYEVFNDDFSSADVKRTETMVIECDEYGNYSDGGSFVGSNAVATSIRLSLDESKMSYSVSGDILNATVKAENTEAVLGVEIESDVSLMITKANERIVSITLTYTTESGNVTVICAYD